MRRLIHSNFKIDLSFFKVTDTEENNWFTENYFTKISFPFTIDLDDDLDEAFDFISQYNTKPETLYPLKFEDDNEISDATFEVQQVSETKVECVYETGLEEFPAWGKKLSELALQKFNLPDGVTIYDHAASVIGTVWPAINYCFPAIHTDKYEAEGDFADFGKTINKYEDGAFLVNDVDGENLSHIRNIMQPLPFYLYLLQAGFAEGGFTLAGDILNDPRLRTAAVFSTKDYFLNRGAYVQDAVIQWDEYFQVAVYGPEIFYAYYTKSITIDKRGEYFISGFTELYGLLPGAGEEPFPILLLILLDGVQIHAVGEDNAGDFQTANFTINDNDPHVIQFLITSYVVQDTMLLDCQVVLTDWYDENGDSLPIILNENHVDLTKAVPDKTFGDFVKETRKYMNYDYTLVGTTIYMNKIQDQLDQPNPLSLIPFEVKDPIRTFKKGLSFLHKFMDIDSKDYSYEPVFQSAAGIAYDNFVTDNKTTTVEIDMLPLPMLERNGIRTAHSFEDSDSKIYLVQYVGLKYGKNATNNPSQLLMPAIHAQYWERWLNFRINSVGFKWVFKAFDIDIKELKAKRKIYAYNHEQIIKTRIRTEIEPGLFEVELESEAIK